MNHIVTASIVVSGLSLIVYSPLCLYAVLLSLLTGAVVCFGIYSVFWIHVLLSSNHKTGLGFIKVQHELETFRSKLMHEYNNSAHAALLQQIHLPVIYGRTVDGLLQQVIDYILRDFINVWLKDYAYDSDILMDNFKEDLWGAVQNLQERLSRIDHSKLIACDMVTKITIHFEKIRLAKAQVAESDRPPLFTVSPHLLSSFKERDYLRHISEMLIMFLLPRSYSLSPAKHLIREILAFKVLKPSIDKVTESDYFNQKVLEYIKAQEDNAAMHKRTFEYAKSFEDFIRMIERNNNVETLKRMRYDIVTEIMQATTLQNMKRAKGVDPDIDKATAVASGVAKAEVAAAKKLKEYISQLTFAKNHCEKRLQTLGWDGGFQIQSGLTCELPLASILEHVTGRRYLSLFLETLASQGLVGYYTAVEELRVAHRSNWHQLGAEIFYTYIKSPSSEIKVDKATRKRIEAFLLGDKGPEVFYEIQKTVVQTLEDKYYQSFLLSPFYAKMVDAMSNDDQALSEIDSSAGPMDERQMSGDSGGSADSGMHVVDHSNYARRKLDELQEKLNNKTQALQAMKSSLKPESRVLLKLEKEVEWLQGEQRQLEAHLSRTEIWGENLGKWRAIVQSAEVPDEREPPQFVIVVHMIQSDSAEGDEGIGRGWVVLRTLTHFQELHRKLRPLCSDVKSLELPSQTFKFLFGKSDKNSLEKAKQQIQKYLEFILEDERLNQSEALYSFLSPSSEHLKHSTPSPKKSRFSFSTLFKSGSGDQTSRDGAPVFKEIEEEDQPNFEATGGGGNLDSVDSATKANGGSSGGRIQDDSKDMIAEPLYNFMNEVFDVRGVFKSFRRTMITFVQITYGRTINRQIRDTISWCFSESMVHYYITVVLRSWWPAGELAPPPSDRPLEVKQEDAVRAKEQFVANVPDVLITLVGDNNAKRGAGKLFDNLQNDLINKQLFYDLLEVLMNETFPELKNHQ